MAKEFNIKFMDIQELVEDGYLQEINRQFLHPLGLALTVSIDDISNEHKLAGIIDFREADTPITFANVNKEKVEKFKSIQKLMNKDRLEKMGFVIQPIDNNGTKI